MTDRNSRSVTEEEPAEYDVLHYVVLREMYRRAEYGSQHGREVYEELCKAWDRLTDEYKDDMDP